MREASAISRSPATAPVAVGTLSAAYRRMPGLLRRPSSRCRPAARVTNLVRPRAEKIIVEADDDVALVQHDNEDRKVDRRPTVVKSLRAASPAAHARELAFSETACRSASSCRSSVGELVGPIRSLKPFALIGFQSRRRVLMTAATSFQVTGSPRRVGALGAIGIVQAENSGLHEDVAAPLRDRMVGIAVELGRSAGIGGGDDRLRVTVESHRCRVIARQARL